MGSTTTPGKIAVHLLTVSDRSFRGEREDSSGRLAAEMLEGYGFTVSGPRVIPDGRESVEGALAAMVEDGPDVILTLGGTGVGARDATPEGTMPLLERELPGIAEGLRANGAVAVPTAVLSRGLAGVVRPSDSAHRTVVVNLPGSVGGVRDGVEYLRPILPHLIDQLRGGDH